MGSSIRRGITLVEVLVVIAIIAILGALLTPAVQYSREAARRAACHNQLRQLALAMHTHEGVHRHLPTGGWGWRWHGEPDRGFDERQPGGWAYNILPYIEQNELRTQAAECRHWRAQCLSKTVAIPISLFVCPSRRAAKAWPFAQALDYFNIARPDAVARSDYAACAGDEALDLTRGERRGPPSLDIGDSPNWLWLELNRSGVVFRRSRVTFGEIIDGLSNTYLVGEKYLAIDDYHTGQAQGDDQHLFVGYDIDTLRSTHPEYPPLPDSLNVASEQSFGSAHASAFHMAMADASVHSVSYGVDQEVHRARGNRYDGQ
jgi:prepilin-type N-terminal cleavage/methylation domain-containing protein